MDDLVIGGRRWSVSAPSPRISRLLGVAYRVRSEEARPDPDLRLVVIDAPDPHADPPVSVAVDRCSVPPTITLQVHDPSLDDPRLHYFLWVNVNAALVRLGEFLVHAATFSIDDRLVLITGPSGAGKSTMALAVGLAGAVVHSDDWSIARTGPDGTVAVSGVTSIMRITDTTRDLLGAHGLDAERSADEKHKWVFDAAAAVRAEPGVHRTPDRIVLLRPGRTTSIRPATAAEVTRHLFEESKQTMYLPDAEGLAAYLDCCTSLALSAPAVHLERGAGPDTIDELLDMVTRP